MAALSWCTASSLLLQRLSVCLQKGRPWAEEKEKLPFSAAEGCVGYPAEGKLNFCGRGQWKRMITHNGASAHGQLLQCQIDFEIRDVTFELSYFEFLGLKCIAY